MINKKIMDKISGKCKNDRILKKFIMEVLNNEEEGRQYNKTYKKFVKEALREIENNEV
jgi:hypothetical protein